MNTHPMVLKLDVSGLPVRWIDWKQAAVIYSRERVRWEAGQDFFVLTGGMRNGEQSKLKINSIIAVADKSRRFAEPPRLTNPNLFHRDRNRCMYCGLGFSASHLTRDHVVPRGQGGLDVWENVVSACYDCNNKKDCKTPEQAHMPLLALPYAPSLAENLLLQNRRILADQMAFLEAFCHQRK